jgi:hypothetical protein
MRIRPKPTPPAEPSTVAQQASDLTSEGTPPPDKVPASGAVTASKKAALPAPVRVPPVRKGPVSRSRWSR